jgi:hypothetical protein
MIRNITILTILLFSFMSVGWGQDCDSGYVWIEDPIFHWGSNWDGNNCFKQSDIDVLQLFIENSSETINYHHDELGNNNGIVEPLELGWQS